MSQDVKIRCYCHGLGDCLLLSLPKADGTAFNILIDCGLHSASRRGTERMRRVVEDVLTACPDGLDVVVGTHEHYDHLSGFLQAADLFEQTKVKEVWFSWAENPADHDARKLDQFKGDAATALADASIRLAQAPGFQATAQGLDALLGFVFGAKGERVRDAREALRGLAPTVRHFNPGEAFALPGVPGVRVHVLGPPRDPKLLGIEDIPAQTYAIGAGAPGVAPLANGLALNDGAMSIDEDASSPFDGSVGFELRALQDGQWPKDAPQASAFFWRHYLDDAADQAWRRIDHDWLGAAAELGLQLDGRTNNTSLVLAFELEESGRVLLFAADAQIGNWMSWDTVAFPPKADGVVRTGRDLVARTVFYKVGHHGSRNATRAADLERMDHANLVAFSPTDASLASRVGWKDFPAPKTAERLKALSGGRFFPADAAWLHDPSVAAPIVRGGALKDYRIKHGLYVELVLA